MCKQKIRSFVKILSFIVGLSDGTIPHNSYAGEYSNSYAIETGYNYQCWLAGEQHPFELPVGPRAIPPRLVGNNIYGCGLVLDHEDKLWIFFTFNGQLMGEF
jgi:hypothetical protein